MNDMDTNIEDARKLKSELEREIAKLMLGYEEYTGFKIDHIDIRNVMYDLGTNKRRYTVHAVVEI